MLVGNVFGGIVLGFAPLARHTLPPSPNSNVPHIVLPNLGCAPHQCARCGHVTSILADDDARLTDAQVTAIFKEFDTSGDGFIDLGELQAALSKAGKPVSLDEAVDILERVDTNNDGQISLEEFRAVFTLTPSAVPDALKQLVDVRSFFDNVGSALGIEVSGQWRTTESGSKYVDDVLGNGELVNIGDVVLLHYTVTLMSTGAVVESSRTERNGRPLGFELGQASADVQGWNDAVQGMRVGGQRRVYATPPDGGDGPTARYDIEVVGVESAAPKSAVEGVLTRLGGRRAVARLLFALSFAPYFLPADVQPAFFKPDFGQSESSDSLPIDDAPPPTVDRADKYVAQQLDDLFSNEVLPSSAGGKSRK